MRRNRPVRLKAKFDYTRNFRKTNFRRHPQLYQVGKGEQGVLLVEPYKSELLPHWRFRTPRIARISAARLFDCFQRYKAQGDFVGMDMARKFLQMGYTRARRYANHKSGRKHSSDRKKVLPLSPDPSKARAADIFKKKWFQAKNDPTYREMKERHSRENAAHGC